MTHSRSMAADDIVATAAAVAEELFAGAAARDAAAAFPDGAFALLHAADLMMAPFPARLGGAGLAEPAAVDALCHVLRAVGGGDLSVGRLYEGHVNAVALVARYGTSRQLGALAEDVRAGAMSGVWNAEGALPATLEHGGDGWRLRGAKILASGVGSVTRPVVPVARGGASSAVTVMTIPHGDARNRDERWERARELLTTVGLRPEFAGRYPHEFSGGQRQRVGIARAIATNPKLLILDEPISALDISIRAQILNLLEDLQAERGISYLFIAHDLSVVRHICERVAVMYLGIIVEQGPSDRVFAFPKHPYTQALLESVPVADPSRRRLRVALDGDAPSPVAIPSGCRFRTRCPIAQTICAEQIPPLRDLGKGQFAACHFAAPGEMPTLAP